MNRNNPPNGATFRSLIDVDAIPRELREREQWVTWKYVVRNGKANKVPFNARAGTAASSTDRSTWSAFEVALATFQSDRSVAGLGFVFSADDPYCGIDLDGCIRDGQITPEAQAIVSEFNTYSEISPSGNGVKLFVQGSKTATTSCCCKRVAGFKQIEIYDRARFFVVTSRKLPEVPALVESRQAKLDALCRRLWPRPKAKVVAPADGTSSGAAGSDRVKRCSAYVSKLPDAISGSGGHNATLRAACECFRFGLSEAEAWDVMSHFNSTKTGGELWTESELRHKLTSAKQKVEAEGEVGVRLLQSPTPTDREALERVEHLPTDMGNAARFVRRFGDRMRYCHTMGKWLAWDSRRWRVDERGRVVQHCKATALSIYDEAKKAEDDATRAQLTDWAKTSQKRERLTAMAALAQPELAVTPDELDRDDWLLNCENGTIDLKTGELRPHRQDDLITKLAPVAFDPEATCPLFEACLLRTFDGSRELITFLQRVLGHSLTGDVSEQYFFIFHGAGGNGKNLILDTVSSVLGDYATEAPPDLVTVRKNPEHPTEIADLLGRRLVIASETERGAELRIQLIKRLTGNQFLKARFMKQDFFQFRRTHKLILVTNNKPVLRENTEAVWRRIRLLAFNVVIPKHERDPKLMNKLRHEYPGILAWLVRGCLDWQRSGLTEPTEVLYATESYREESGGIAAFLREHCEFGSDLWCPAAALLESYQHWCRENHQLPLQASALGCALRRNKCADQKRRGQRGWVGVNLKSVSVDGLDRLDSRVRLTAS